MKLCINILLLIISINCFSQGRVLISNLAPEDTIAPGSHFTLVFTVNLFSEAIDSVKTNLVIPEDWSILSQRSLPSTDQNSLRFFYSIATRENNRAGFAQVRFETFISGKLRGFKVVDIRIQEIRKIDIVSLPGPELIKEGETLTSEYLVQNLGNRPEQIKITSQNAEIAGEAENITIEPNASIRVTTTQLIPYTERETWWASSGIMVEAKGLSETFNKYVSLPVYSSRKQKTDLYRRFPLEVGAAYMNYFLGNRKESGYQFFIKGQGALDFGNKHFLDIYLRGPNQWLFPVVGSQDHYSLEYAYKKDFRVIAGDYYLSFNNLMEFGRYGRGAFLEGRVGRVSARSFYQKARFFPFQKDSHGADISYNWSENTRATASYFSKNTFVKGQWLRTEMFGLSGMHQNAALNVEMEAALGVTQGKVDVGFFNRINYNVRKWTISGNFIFTGKEFYGFYTNSRLINGNVAYFFNPKLNLGMNYNYTLINPSLDITVYNTSPFIHQLMAYTTYMPNDKHRFFFNYTVGERVDRQEPATFDFNENYGNLSYNYEGKKVRVFTQSRYGFTQNNLVTDGEDRPKQRYISNLLQPNYQVLRGVWLGGYFEHQYTSRFSQEDWLQNLFFVGGNLNATYKGMLNMHLMYRNSYAPDQLYQTRSFLDARVVLDLKHHKITFNAGRVYLPNPELRDQNTLYFALTYALKLNVPTAKLKRVGKVTGRVTGLRPDIRKDGMLVRVGGKEYLTDHTGAFSFDKILEGKYMFSLQQTNPDMGVVPLQRAPQEIVVTKDSSTFVEIQLTRTGNISGKLEFKENGDSEPGRRPIVLVKLYNESISQLTDIKNGEFTFKEILPGTWKVRAFFPGESPEYEIELEEQTVSIEPNETRDLTFVVKSKERKIFFSNHTFQISYKK